MLMLLLEFQPIKLLADPAAVVLGPVEGLDFEFHVPHEFALAAECTARALDLELVHLGPVPDDVAGAKNGAPLSHLSQERLALIRQSHIDFTVIKQAAEAHPTPATGSAGAGALDLHDRFP